jgi:hypothetical protein
LIAGRRRAREGKRRHAHFETRHTHAVSLLKKSKHIMMAAIGFSATSVGVAARQGEAASCSGIGHGGNGGGVVAGGGGGAFGAKRVCGGGVQRQPNGGSRKGGVKALGWAVAAAGSSTLGYSGVSATPGAASQRRNGSRRRASERGLGVVTAAVGAVNRNTKSLDEMDPEHVTFASQDELDHR